MHGARQAFARLWTVGIDGDCATLQQKQEGCRSAVKAHSTMIRDCAKGKVCCTYIGTLYAMCPYLCTQGVDRHFYALRAMATKHGVPMPALFSTSAYSTFSTIVLSTSNCGNPALRMFGFGPVCPQGFGIGESTLPSVVGSVIDSDTLTLSNTNRLHHQRLRNSFLCIIKAQANFSLCAHSAEVSA